MTKKGTIFYIHGNSSSSRVFQNIVNSKKVNYSQIAFDLPGHGKNGTSEDSVDFSTKRYCDFLLAKIKDINDDILLVGNSLGGHLALEIAPKVRRLKGLVIFGTPPLKKPINPQDAFLNSEALNTFLKENPDSKEVEETIASVLFNKNLVNYFIDDFKRTNPKVRSVLADELQSGNWSDQAGIFLELHIPKLVIIGDKDISVNSEYIKNLADKDRNLCELICLENCGHYASMEKPLEFESIMLNMAKKVFTR